MWREAPAQLIQAFFSPGTKEWQAQRQHWVQDSTRRVAIITGVASLVILVGIRLKFFTFQETLPLFLLTGANLIAAVVSTRGGWRWAAYVPPLSFLALGIYGSVLYGFASTLVLFYALAVLMSGILIDRRNSLFAALVCTACYSVIGLSVSGDARAGIPAIITLFFCLTGISAMQSYTQARLQKINEQQAIWNQRLEASEKKFRTIIESLPLGIHMYSVDDDSRLVFSGYNPAADRILGLSHQSFLGMTIEQVFPGLRETEILEQYRKIAKNASTGHAEQLSYANDTIQGTFDVHAFQSSPGKIVTVFSDITERIQAAQALRASEEKFAMAFHTSPDSVNINRLKDGMYIDINEGFTRLMGYTWEEVVGKSSLDLNIWYDPEDRRRLVKGLLEDGFVENLEAQFVRKSGAIGIGLMSARVIDIQGEKCILSITRDITQRIQAERDLQAAHAELEQAYSATLTGWARALELRERETANHSWRVVEYTSKVCQAMGIEGRELLQIQWGALLHDIGKLGVPDQILLKSEPLTPEEWKIMREHPGFGRELLIDIAYLRQSIDIPYCHHEKWDGSGYPRGLREEEIPLAARIFAVVDVYDALTNDRPYRKAWTHEAAQDYLREQCGKHFDPACVEAFLHIL